MIEKNEQYLNLINTPTKIVSSNSVNGEVYQMQHCYCL